MSACKYEEFGFFNEEPVWKYASSGKIEPPKSLLILDDCLYDNKWTEKFNSEHFNQIFYEVGRNPNKGFLMIDDTLWGLCQFDVSMKGRNLKRLKVPDQILNEIAEQIGFQKREEYKYPSNIYYVDQN